MTVEEVRAELVRLWRDLTQGNITHEAARVRLSVLSEFLRVIELAYRVQSL